MHTPAPPRRRSTGRTAAAARLLAASATLVAATLLTLGGALPAAAHTELRSSDPADGDTLKSAPTEVVLTFTEDVQPEFSQVAVLDAAGTAHQRGSAKSDGDTVTQPVAGLDAGGTFTVSYRVVAADGHPITGTLSFDVTAPSPTLTPTPTPTPEPTSNASATPTAAVSSPDEQRPWGWLAASSVAAAAIGIAAYAWSRRRPRERTAATTPSSPAGDAPTAPEGGETP